MISPITIGHWYSSAVVRSICSTRATGGLHYGANIIAGWLWFTEGLETPNEGAARRDQALSRVARLIGFNAITEGNFRALFESIERDQIRRGVLTRKHGP